MKKLSKLKVGSKVKAVQSQSHKCQFGQCQGEIIETITAGQKYEIIEIGEHSTYGGIMIMVRDNEGENNAFDMAWEGEKITQIFNVKEA